MGVFLQNADLNQTVLLSLVGLLFFYTFKNNINNVIKVHRATLNHSWLSPLVADKHSVNQKEHPHRLNLGIHLTFHLNCNAFHEEPKDKQDNVNKVALI